MTKLIETDEEVEKAGKGMIPRGGTSKLQLKLRSAGKGSPRTRRYLLNRTKGGPIHGEAAGRRRGVYKANAPTALEALDSAIEKARGLLVEKATYYRGRPYFPHRADTSPSLRGQKGLLGAKGSSGSKASLRGYKEKKLRERGLAYSGISVPRSKERVKRARDYLANRVGRNKYK